MDTRAGWTPVAVADRTGSRRIAAPGVVNACYFRSGPTPGRRKALLKITDRCDLRCAHCFVSATADGNDMALECLDASVGRLVEARVESVTVTGGEPLVHPHMEAIIGLLVAHDLDVTVCTNAVSVTDGLVGRMVDLGRVSFNVSLDGFSAESHGAFRGDRSSFATTVENTRRLGDAGLLKGILSTPNSLAATTEFTEVFAFARANGADFVLLNPLSSFGRGIRTRRRLRADDQVMREIAEGLRAERGDDDDPEQVLIRFPNDAEPLSGCVAGDLFYVFPNGDTTVCPYLVFATENVLSRYARADFVAANLFEHADFASRLERYDFRARYRPGDNQTCRSCSLEGSCGKGCPAAVVAAGGSLGDVDAEVCPVASRETCS